VLLRLLLLLLLMAAMRPALAELQIPLTLVGEVLRAPLSILQAQLWKRIGC